MHYLKKLFKKILTRLPSLIKYIQFNKYLLSMFLALF